MSQRAAALPFRTAGYCTARCLRAQRYSGLPLVLRIVCIKLYANGQMNNEPSRAFCVCRIEHGNFNSCGLTDADGDMMRECFVASAGPIEKVKKMCVTVYDNAC